MLIQHRNIFFYRGSWFIYVYSLYYLHVLSEFIYTREITEMHRIVQIIVKIMILPLYTGETSTSVKFYS